MAPKNNGILGGNNPRPNNISGSIPSGFRIEDPTVPFQGNSLGDTVYVLMQNVWDPRTLQTSTISGTSITTANRYSVIAPGYDYLTLTYDYLYRAVFAARPGRQEPDPIILTQMLDCICDINRMLGIYLTALSAFNSKDPEMYQRSRQLGFMTGMDEMMTILRILPLPRTLAQTTIKYVGLFDTSSADMYQNVGFLVNGDFDAFLQLYNNVRSRALALSWLRQLYPDLGEIGDPGNGFSAEKLELFINCGFKGSTGNYSPWTNIGVGGNLEVKQLASAGIMYPVINGTRLYSQSGFAAPGGGIGGVASQRISSPCLCRWNGSKDASITRAFTQAYSVAASAINFESITDVDLAANLGHEYNMMTSDTSTQATPVQFDGTTGVLGLAAVGLTIEDTRYRVSAGMSISQMSYRLDGNIMDGIGMMLRPE